MLAFSVESGRQECVSLELNPCQIISVKKNKGYFGENKRYIKLTIINLVQ
jgi:hypothetical protein